MAGLNFTIFIKHKILTIQAFRQIRNRNLFQICNAIFKLEPITGTSPKFPEVMKSKTKTALGTPVAISCPAQAFPSPGFR